MWKFRLFLFFFLLPAGPLFASSSMDASEDNSCEAEYSSKRDTLTLELRSSKGGQDLFLVRPDSSDSVAIPHSEPRRGVAIALTVLLGPLGGHRLYLGTEPKVPVLYTVTLGGGLGLLPLIDLVQLIVTDDLDKFHDHSRVFMWRNKRKSEEDEEGED